MPIHVYEGMFILDSNKYAKNHAEIPDKLVKLVTDRGGEMLVNRLWNEQKLAYPVKGHRKGVYWLTYFRLEGTKLSELNEQVKLTDGVLRALVLKIDPRLVDALVEHASHAPAPDAGDEKEAESKPAEGKGGERKERGERGESRRREKVEA